MRPWVFVLVWSLSWNTESQSSTNESKSTSKQIPQATRVCWHILVRFLIHRRYVTRSYSMTEKMSLLNLNITHTILNYKLNNERLVNLWCRITRAALCKGKRSTTKKTRKEHLQIFHKLKQAASCNNNNNNNNNHLTAFVPGQPG